MQLKTIALAAAALAAAQGALAQNNAAVTLYGVVDANVQVLDAKNSLARVQSGGLSGSRFGIKGTEDLGGGLRALFVLESGINLDEGTNGQGAFWGRQAYVGLGTPYGTVSLGRQYGSLYTLSGDFSQFSNNNVGASTAVIGGFGGYEPVRGSNTTLATNGGPARVNNSIRYETPNIGGFSAGTLLGLGETAGANSDNRLADVYARYSDGALDAMVSFVDDKSQLTGLQVRTSAVAAAYGWSNYRVNAGVISVNDRSVGNNDGEGYWLGGSYRLGQHLFKTQYVESKLRHSVVDGKTQAIGVGYQYDLSKRTSLYSSLTQFKNDGVGYTARAAGSFPANVVSADKTDITEVVAGIRHTF